MPLQGQDQERRRKGLQGDQRGGIGMELEDFLKEVTEKLEEKLGERYTFIRKDIDGLNGTKKHSLLVMDKRKDTNIHPCIRMDDHFRDHMSSGCSMDRIVDEIAAECRKENDIQDMDISCFTGWDSVRHYILGKLVNTERNRGFLEDVPYREYLDLSLVYYAGIQTGKENSPAAVQIRKGHMEYWGVDEETLYREAMKNMDHEADFNSMGNVISQLTGEEETFLTGGQINFPMFILKNKQRGYGAVQICNTNVMKGIARYFASDFWVLPSSIHEVILVPCCWSEPKKEEFAAVVREVNDTQVLPQEVLSYHVYRYHSQTDEMTVEA